MKQELSPPEDQVNLRSNRDVRRLGYLSAAPRVSTRGDAETSGPRAHILGVIEAFTALGWQVYSYIVGDRVPRTWIVQSERKLEQSVFIRFGADMIRLVMGIVHSLLAWRELKGRVNWVYERFAVLQNLGWILQLAGTPWILETNGLFFYEAKTERKSVVLSGVARVLELWAYHHCDVLICVTDALKGIIVQAGGIPAEKILVIPNGVDTTRFNPSQYEPKRICDGPALGFVGSLVNWHRLDVLLIALAELVGESVDLNLVIVGDGPMRGAWELQARELEIHDRVYFVGRVIADEIPAYISGFDLGFAGNAPLEIGVMYHSPLKLYEYMAMARPVIASAYADAREMILPGRHGYLFEPGDKEDLKRALRTAYQDRARWREMGLESRARVIEKASWQARVEKLIVGVERILEEQRAVLSAGN
ncbi:MAG: glycosyltransferase [Anaerolineales bacterium]|nr:glycosyltransferase [Anaerolineales bacterium]